jgi:hypothetical protein
MMPYSKPHLRWCAAGTGKTRTLLAMMAVLVATAKGSVARRHAMGPLLATAGTNAAVDNLLEGLEARGIKAVRVGNPAKVRGLKSCRLVLVVVVVVLLLLICRNGHVLDPACSKQHALV